MSKNDDRSRYYGKYRGVVTKNEDPSGLGRIVARVPDVFGAHNSGWALPSTPYAGNGVGLFLIPPVGARVWIEFEQGDPEDPIWSGCFWAEGEVPADPPKPTIKILKTEKCTITLNDEREGIIIETSDGRKIRIDPEQKQIEITNGQGRIKMDDTKIEIKNNNEIEISNGQGSVKLTGMQVSVNNGALEVS